jgi:dolichyl-phosphate-mannose--protein O-mannosyl transferase
LSASAQASFAPADAARGGLTPLWTLLGVGLVLRLLFIGSDGFHNDVQAFESWTMTLRDHPPWDFYSNAGFSDYPPGYFVVLWVVGKIYALIGGGDQGYTILRTLVKLPAIVMDLVDAAVIYAIVRRYAAQTVALVAAAALALNPAAIYVSSYWGQVDSVSWGLVLISLWCLLRVGDVPGKTVSRVTWAWLALAFSVLMKPQAATIGLLFLAYPFATDDATVRLRRLKATAVGVGSAFALALVVGLLFHPSADVFGWLFGRYAYGSNVYPYNTVNAFNLYAIRQPFWEADSTPLSLFGLSAGPLSAWGIALVLAATLLIVGRYAQRRDDRALLDAAMLCALAFFILATRMHERYVYGAFLLALPLIGFGRAGWWSSLVLTVTMYLNLAYSLAYQTVMNAKTSGVDTRDLWPAISHPAALINVALFFWLGYLYLGGAERVAEAAAVRGDVAGTVLGTWIARGRAWFDPREGVVAMTRLDVLLAAAFTVGSFVLCAIALSFPHEKIFDEVYYARAGEEYLRHADVAGLWSYEFTHPPITKLLIALSMLLFGGLHGLGDTAIGWRFLNVVVGALTVGLLYAFAKRLAGSTPFAAFGAGMLALDGFHYVQSRIATPEITVAFFSLLTLYAFYRLWLASQVAARAAFDTGAVQRAFVVTLGIGLVAAIVGAFAAPSLGPIKIGAEFTSAARVALAAWVFVVFWWIGRVVVVPRLAAGKQTSYADGTRILTGDASPFVEIAGGVRARLDGSATVLAEQRDDDLVRTIDGAGTLTYAIPAATAVYRAAATVTVDERTSRASDARFWWFALPIAAGLLAASKWNGLFDFGVVWAIAAAVGAQRWMRGPAFFGNPFGAPLDVVAAAMIVTGGVVYLAAYIPYFALGHGFVDLVSMQWQMYHYHATLVATHPYASQWWQWPLLDKPILYYAHYTHTAASHGACCVSTIRALPNPIVWWFGLISVPYVGWLAYRERNKGYALLIVAYLFQWLPWIASPRLSFEYHFYPNLAIIVLANAIVLQRVWNHARDGGSTWPRYAVVVYGVAVVASFVYFFPIVSGYPINWDAWQARMWNPHWI